MIFPEISLSIIAAFLFVLLMVAVWDNIKLRQDLNDSRRMIGKMQCELADFIRSARSANDLASKSQFVKMFP